MAIYRIPFMSRAGVSCRVDISGIDGTGITVLSPDNPSTPGVAAARPVEIDEDDDSNLLNVIRTKSGYVNLVELQTGALDVLRPLTSTQLGVEIYYDGDIVFKGYVQAQSFDNVRDAAPRVVKVPICSTLHVIASRRMPVVTGEGGYNFGTFMHSMFNTHYDDVLIPRDMVSDPEPGVVNPTLVEVNARTIVPWNGDYGYGVSHDGVEPSVYAPITYREFLEGFCNLFGLIVHEYGKTLIFVSYNYSEQYVRIDVGDLGDVDMDATGLPTGDAILHIEDYFAPAGDDDTEGLVLPLGKLTYDYGEYKGDVTLDLSRSKFVGLTSLPQHPDWGTLAVLNPQTNEFASNFFSTECGDQSQTNHVRVLGDSNSQMVEIRMLVAAGESRDVEIFRYMFTNVPSAISGAEIESTFTQPQQMRIQVVSGGMYYSQDHDWVAEPTFLLLTFDENGRCNTFDVASADRTVTVKFFPPDTPTSSVVGIIKSMRLTIFTPWYRKYIMSTDMTTVVYNDNPCDTDETVSMLFNQHSLSVNRVEGGSVPRNTYRYLFKSQARQRRRALIKQAVILPHLYLHKLTTEGSPIYWRLIALGFDPWNDEYKLTIQGSDTLT